MLNLKFYEGNTLQYSYFTPNERDLALHVAAQLDARNMRPRLYSATFDGKFKVLYDWKSRAKKVAKKPAPIRLAA